MLNGNLDNIFQILEQEYAKTELVGGFDTFWEFLKNNCIIGVKYSSEL